MMLLIIGFSGIILFFPVNFDNQLTCLFQRLGTWDYDGQPVNKDAIHSHDNRHVTGGSRPVFFLPEELHHHYMQLYSYFWWGSLLLFGISIYALRHAIALPGYGQPPSVPDRIK